MNRRCRAEPLRTWLPLGANVLSAIGVLAVGAAGWGLAPAAPVMLIYVASLGWVIRDWRRRG